MDHLFCSDCKRQFGSHVYDVEPRVLTCGHSFCYKCVDKLITLKYDCPKCKGVIGVSSASALSRNETLLTMAEAIFESTNKCDLFDTYVSVTSKHFEDLVICVNKIKNTGQWFKFLRSERDFDYRITRLTQEFKEVRSQFNTLELLFPKYGYIDLNLYPKDNDGDETFLHEIMNKLEDGEKIYAAIVLDCQIKYGSVTSDVDSILVNSLTRSERETESSYFWFSEFKSRFRNKIFSFLTFRFKGYINIELNFEFEINDNWRDSDFLKHCTGESGFAFKNSSYSFIDEDTLEIGKAINDMPDNLDTIVNKDDVVVCLLSSGRCGLRQFNNSDISQSVKNVIGKLNNRVILTDIVDNKRILESGIVVHSRSLAHRVKLNESSKTKLQRLSEM